MVRPKASKTNLVAAVTFADILIVREQAYRSNTSFDRVYCKGSGSLYHAFHALLPELTRGSLDKNPENRQGVSMIELNKALKITGLKSARKRDRMVDGVIRRCKVKTIFSTLFFDSARSMQSFVTKRFNQCNSIHDNNNTYRAYNDLLTLLFWKPDVTWCGHIALGKL